jgi:hypothetical protein
MKVNCCLFNVAVLHFDSCAGAVYAAVDVPYDRAGSSILLFLSHQAENYHSLLKMARLKSEK